MSSYQLFDALPAHIEAALRKQWKRTGLVYFIQAYDGTVKIGWAIHPSQRLRNLQVGSAWPLRIVALGGGGQKAEAWLHRRLAESRIAGEWFKPTRLVCGAIEQARLEVGVPA